MTMHLSGELAQNVLELAPDATVVVGENGIIVFANAQVEHTFGYAPQELYGKPVELLLPERFRGQHHEHRARFALQPKPRAMGEALTLLGRHKAGREFPVEISLSPVRSDDGAFVIAAVRDATVRRDTERGLIEANRAKSRLLAAASHDLRQPVQTLTLLNQAALRHAAADAKLTEILEQEKTALGTISQLLTSVLDVSKLDSGAVQPTIESCLIDDVFARLQSDFEPHAEEKGIALLVTPTPEAGRTDPELLRRLLSNLLSNAIRYTVRGSVEVRCSRAGDELAIVVRDTGIGIPRNQLDKVFVEFYQVDHGPQRPEGLGLGLSIVTRLAALLNHRIAVESTIGEGTTFTVTLPRAAVDEDAARGPVAAVSYETRGKILIVDDELPVAQATSLLLELEGFEVSVASGRREALERIRAARPDLIISDYHLRGAETGADVVAIVRERLGTDVPAIFVTGDTSKVARAGARLDNTTLLSKPTQVDDLLSAIHRHLSSAASARALGQPT